ncbi:MAG: c-type cytochrome, partial [Planctomycetales bacterium]|nr:c-type cytochrome [Planctomycetales bacterium]
YLRAWAIQLAVPTTLPKEEPKEIPERALEKLVDMATNDDSSIVRLYIASALQRLPLAQRWLVADALLQHGDDADDHNLPLMIWYGVEPLVPANAARAMQLAERSKIPVVTRYIARRTAAEPTLLNTLVASLPKASADRKGLIVDEILQAFAGRVDIPMPVAWNDAYTHLLESDNRALRDKADQIAIVLGDKRLLPRMRRVLADSAESVAARNQAIEVLLRGRDEEAASAFIAALDEAKLRGKAIRALAGYSAKNTPAELLRRYAQFNDSERRDAISTLTSRPAYAMALLDAVEKKVVARSDIHAYHVRQLRSFDNARIVERIQQVWGAIRETSADKKQKIETYKTKLAAEHLKDADLSHGRVVFNKTCASCHRLFGHGESIGPDITGSNRANLDYILENAIDPSSVVSNDYKMTTLTLNDGRLITGLIEKETDSAVTIRTVNDVLLIAKSDVEERDLSPLSLMPEGQLDALSDHEVRDLIAYLASPSQVPLPRVALPIDASTGKVAGAIEAESMKIVGKTDGDARSQAMGSFKADRWSGNDQLWWTGQKQGSQLDLEISAADSGTYAVEVVLTRAIDYGIVELSIDDKPIGGPIDCFVSGRVDNTGVLRLGPVELSQGNHKLSAKMVGKHEKATAFMFGLDYVRLAPVE